MAFLVAVASVDGRYINRHFATTDKFWIFRLMEDRFYLDDVRDVDRLAHANHKEMLLNLVEGIADCNMVLAQQIGPGAAVMLGYRGMEPYVAEGEIEEVLNRIAWLQKKRLYRAKRRTTQFSGLGQYW